MILHAGKELQGAVARPLARLSWTARSEQAGGKRIAVSRLASFVGGLRAQLAVLTEGKSVAGLREGLGGETLLASVRVAAHPRLVPVPLVLAGGREFKPGHVQRGRSLALCQETEPHSDEGGIYSW
ncbi:MAG TPA: hypothetical protein VLQ93_16640 [Myxococcaceae bacterium]|nr:hypothetical protein [Myxococcaceae bacterium]